MPALERIDMRFQAFEGIYGIETLKSLQELHLSVGNQADEVTKFLVEELKDNANRNYLDDKYAKKWPKIISDWRYSRMPLSFRSGASSGTVVLCGGYFWWSTPAGHHHSVFRFRFRVCRSVFPFQFESFSFVRFRQFCQSNSCKPDACD